MLSCLEQAVKSLIRPLVDTHYRQLGETEGATSTVSVCWNQSWPLVCANVWFQAFLSINKQHRWTQSGKTGGISSAVKCHLKWFCSFCTEQSDCIHQHAVSNPGTVYLHWWPYFVFDRLCVPVVLCVHAYMFLFYCVYNNGTAVLAVIYPLTRCQLTTFVYESSRHW